ncbi:MAG: T9SS type A sorting domain-containing protein [Ignavibacteriaceae bacterium]|nr:T9SS type A sorting domain-containing protein [Ignavibacteriaceae bacterium]
MKKLVLMALLVLVTNIEAQNLLKFLSRNSQQWMYGNMKDITLVVAPQGGYVENSLYINYQSSGSFSQWQVHHSFELPEDAVVNDLWLWVGNQVIKARVIDSWKASTIFDSVVSVAIDPALLTKKGNFYELRIFPINANQTRRVKITYTTPLKNYGGKYGIDLPVPLMKSGTASTMPVHILFRNNFGYTYTNPQILEASNIEFSNRADTLGFNYKYALIPNVKTFQSLNLIFDHNLETGYLFESGRDSTGKNFMSIAVEPISLFNNDSTTFARKILFAFDLSGDQYKFNTPDFKNTLKRYVKESTKHGDYINILFRGVEDSVLLSDTFFIRSDATIDLLMNNFYLTPAFERIVSKQKHKILFADPTIKNYHPMHLIHLYADVAFANNILDASYELFNYDIVVSGNHNNYFNSFPDQKDSILNRIREYVSSGGIFIVQAMDNFSYESIMEIFSPGFQKIDKINNTTTLYKKETPNGLRLQDEFLTPAHFRISHNDPTLEIDLVRANNNPVQATKRFGEGYIVFNGIDVRSTWGGFHTVHYPGISSYNVSKAPSRLNETLSDIRTIFERENFTSSILISNSDVPFSRADAMILSNQYVATYGQSKPVFNSINNIEYYNTVFLPYINEPEIRYHGSGILPGKIAIQMNGKHFERVTSSIDQITSSLRDAEVPSIEYANINAKLNNGLVLPTEEIYLNRVGGVTQGNPIYKLVKHDAADSVEVAVQVKFRSNPEVQIKKYSHTVINTPLIYNQTVPMMLANEKIKIYSAIPPFDTATVVNMAIDANILFRFSAMICLEPNDTTHPLINPWDESNLTDIIEDLVNQDTVFTFDVYPNPFNSQTKISFNLTEISTIRLEIFDITGRLVTTLADGEYSTGRQTFSWNTVNNSNEGLSSGIYFVRLITNGISTGGKNIHYKKLMYLK